MGFFDFVKDNLGIISLILGMFIVLILSLLFYSLYVVNQMKESEEKMKILNAELQERNDIFANAGYGIWRIDLRPNRPYMMEINDTLKQIFGIADMELSPEYIYRFYHERVVDNVDEIEDIDYISMQNGERHARVLEWKHPTKGIIYLNAGGTRYTRPDGESFIAGYCGDITEQRIRLAELNTKLESALVAANAASKAKSDFLFNMSHDIRTPMNAIIGYTDLTKKHIHDTKVCEDYLNKIKLSGDFLLSLINNTLEMARIESGKMVLDEEPGNVCEVTSEVHSVYTELMKNKGITYIQQIDVEKDLVILCDKVKIKEIFLNLVSNAYKYTPEGGQVSVITHALPTTQPGYVTIQTIVSDTGIGMSEEYLPHLFEEFTREYSSTENKIQGTGLGMSIIKKLLTLMNGTIEVESELGKGSTFTVTITHKIADSDTEHQIIEVTDDDFTGKRILIAEDNELNTEILLEILSEFGLQAEHAQDGIICVDMLVRAPAGYYDMILMDIQMPNMDGYKATRKIRRLSDPEKCNIPIVAMTANAFEEDKRDALDAGMNGHLSKPIDMQKLIMTLTEILKKPH